jgi:hypothetical protein
MKNHSHWHRTTDRDYFIYLGGGLWHAGMKLRKQTAFFPFTVVMLSEQQKEGFGELASTSCSGGSPCYPAVHCLILQKGILSHLIFLQRCIVLGHTRIVFRCSVPVLQI